jgi:hypothetical protein
MIWAPNSACLSDAQCTMLQNYVNQGGKLLATHLTSVADEHGKVRKNFGLNTLFGADFLDAEPVEIPDLYLKLADGTLLPQDPKSCASAPTAAKYLQRPSTAAAAPTWARLSSARKLAKAKSSISAPASTPSMKKPA